MFHNELLFHGRRGIFLEGRSHLTRLGASVGGGGLTCLSVRCLSSYLIFSASSSDQRAEGENSPHRRASVCGQVPVHLSPHH